MGTLASILLGLLPESLYFTLFLAFAKELKARRVALFLSIFAASITLSAFLSYTVWYHAALLATMYLIMRVLYKSEIIDVFLVSLSFLILTALGASCYFLIPDYAIALIANRGIMFLVVFGLRHKLRSLYLTYHSLWNKNDKAKIKSITIRNISVITLNVLIFAIAIGMTFFSTKLGGDSMIWSFFGFCDTKDGE